MDDSQSIEGEEGDEEIEHFTVENSYLEEKHSALTSIIRMAQKIPNHIAPQRFDKLDLHTVNLLCRIKKSYFLAHFPYILF